MPVARGNRPSAGFTSVNKKKRTEISDELLPGLTDVTTLMRNANNVLTSTSFHVDSRPISSGTYKNYYKVDIQLRTGPTVAEIMVGPRASSARDAKSGFESSLDDGHIYIVT
jgi:hypothetical protein